MSIIQMPTSNYWANRGGFSPRWLIIHGTAGGSSPQGVAQDFINSQGTNNPKSTHYIIGQDGTVVQSVQEKDAAWGNGVPEAGCDPWWNNGVNPNLVTISIEHVKPDTTNGIPLTDAQKAASFNLIRDICTRWGIPKRKADANGGITGHFSISPVDRARCPGTYPWQELFVFLGSPSASIGDDMLNITDPFPAAYFKENVPGRWYCAQTNCEIIGGILEFYRKIQGAPRLPITGENYDIPNVAYQVFESGIIVWDQQHKLDGFAGVYMLKLDSPLAQKVLGIQALKDQLAKAQPVDKAAIQAALQAAQASLQAALSKVQ